ncbi:MAG TPA: glycosyltransferase family 9 protein [Acidobacteriota bacterium]|nr:glycosyltransferase family 9 protein [Acidobacteriota bacterium]
MLIGLYPETSGTQSAWPASRFAEVAGLLVNHYNARIALVGEAKNSPVIKDVAAKLRNEYQHEVVMLAGIPVAERIAGLACCTLMVTAEAGWARLSAAVDTPTVLLTDTRDEHLDPDSAGQRHHFLYQPQLEAISTDQVFDVICGMLRTSRTGALFNR